MTYPGNASLAPPVKERVVTTFKQALQLYRQGRTDEVIQGCNLILQMDPAFDPAKKLIEKARNPMALIDVDSLLPVDNAVSLDQAREAMARRDFDRVVHLTTDILNHDFLNEEARALGDEAREKLEAAPFIEQFVRRCEQQLAAGNIAAAKADLEKARSLDATHPEVARIARTITDRGTTPVAKEPTPAFVVDAKPAFDATGRGTAQAADFGFTFEEEKTPSTNSPFGSFSFDTPSTPSSSGAPAFDFGTPPSAGGSDFDFSTASIDMSPDDQAKISQYLADGDRAMAAGDAQQAIDLWSRIFLIDVTNDQASERIERAKAKRREVEGQIEDLLSEGQAALDRHQVETAREKFQAALQLDPNSSSAREALARLDVAANAPTARTNVKSSIRPIETPPPSSAPEPIDIFADEEMPEGFESPLVPPDPTAAKATSSKTTTKKATAAPSTGRKLPMGAILGVLLLVLAAGGGWYAYTHFFQQQAADPAATEMIFSRAQSLAKKGRYEQAIAALQEVPTNDPQHDRALEMIADLKSKKSSGTQMFDGKPAGEFFADNVTQAKAAFDAHDYDAAKKAYENAMRAGTLDPTDRAQFDQASQQVAKLASAKTLFREQKYPDALQNLQALLATDPSNKNVQRMINDAHFNLGASALQDERTKDAIAQFDEVLKVDPNDELARRSRELAVRYDNQPKDLLYRIYVKYLPQRTSS